jgi:hypothetical protein
MSFYAFSLDFIDVKFQRGKLTDVDVITFSILVNQVLRAKGVGKAAAATGGSIAFGAVPIDSGSGNVHKGQGRWVAGPLSIAPGDQVSICYSGTNISDTDSQLNAQQQGEVEIKILDAVVSAAVGAIGGAVASAISSALGFIGDPIGKFLGFSKQGPCNGTVFSDAVTFTDTAMANLAFQSRFDPDVPGSSVFSFNRSYTDEATHDTSVCGHIAESNVSFSIYQIPASVSLRFYGGARFGLRTLTRGIRPLAAPPFTARALLLV